MQVVQLQAFRDNYIFCVQSQRQKSAIVIDPGEAAPVLTWWQSHGRPELQIWCTHHHADHVGGVREIVEHVAGIRVFAPSLDSRRFPEVTDVFPERISFDDSWVTRLELSGHTFDHIGFYFEESRAVFVGDTLFSYGCGRVFDGTPESLFKSLTMLAALPDETRVYCAHEYTESNLLFATKLDPDDVPLRARYAEVQARRREGLPTVPSSIGTEKRLNPFLRTHDPKWVHRVLGEHLSPLEAFRLLRTTKDSPAESKFRERFQ